MTSPVPAGAGGVDRAVEAVLRHVPRQQYVIDPMDDLNRRDVAKRIVRDVYPVIAAAVRAEVAAALAAAEQRADTAEAATRALDAAMKRVRESVHEIVAEAEPEPAWHTAEPLAELSRCNALRWAASKVSVASRVGPDPWSSRPVQPDTERSEK